MRTLNLSDAEVVLTAIAFRAYAAELRAFDAPDATSDRAVQNRRKAAVWLDQMADSLTEPVPY